MAGTNSKSSHRLAVQLLMVTAAAGAGFIASNQRWIDIARWPVIGRFVPQAADERVAKSSAATAEKVSFPPEEDAEVELPVELADAQFEPEVEPDDDDDELNIDFDTPGSRDRGVMAAVHEEEAFEAEGDLEESAPPRKLATRDEEATEPASPGAARNKTPARRVSRTVESEESAARETGPALMDLSEIDVLYEQGDYVSAQRELSRWYFRDPPRRSSIQSKLNRMSQALYFAQQPHYYEPYTVEAGDQLRTIGKKYQVSWEYLAKLNRVSPAKIRQGQKLKIVPGPFGVVVSLSRFELTVHLAGSYVKRYRVGVGKDGSSPVGTFPVKNKQTDPTYYGPDGVIRNDDPENPLGERWIDIGDSFGIHGTNEPESIGKAESRGCIRMQNQDVAEVYDFLVIGSEVTIER